jgi:hypothetical protein
MLDVFFRREGALSLCSELAIFAIRPWIEGLYWLELGEREQDEIRQNETRQEKATQDKTRQDKTRQGKTRPDKTRQDKTRQDKTRQDKTRQRQDMTERGRGGTEKIERLKYRFFRGTVFETLKGGLGWGEGGSG